MVEGGWGADIITIGGRKCHTDNRHGTRNRQPIKLLSSFRFPLAFILIIVIMIFCPLCHLPLTPQNLVQFILFFSFLFLLFSVIGWLKN